MVEFSLNHFDNSFKENYWKLDSKKFQGTFFDICEIHVMGNQLQPAGSKLRYFKSI